MILQNGQTPPQIPGLFVNVVPPQTTFLSPAPTGILGVVGTAPWGPVNAPTNVGGLNDYATKFGNPQNRVRDMGTAVWVANLQGAQQFKCVRVTDATDVAAAAYLGMSATPTKVSGGTGFVANDTVTFSNGAVITVDTVTGGVITTFHVSAQPTAETSGTLSQTATSGVGTTATFSFVYVTGATVAGKYTGSLGNQALVSLSPGSQANTRRVIVNLPGLPVETFDNIGSGLTANALWIAIVAAINSGNAVRGGSNLIVATAGASTDAPATSTAALSGGTDGASGVTDTTLIGADTTPRSGMYALRTQNCSVGMLADCVTPATWPTQVAFGLSEGIYMIGVTAAGDTISDAVSNKASDGVDSYAFKLMFGDWCFFLDSINGLTRLVSPQGFIAGWIAANGPQYSSLNKQLAGIVGTQKSQTNTVYFDDDLQTLNRAGIDVITNPVPGGSYFGARLGCNASSNPATNGDNYTRMTNFIAATLNLGLGPFVGRLQSPTVQQNAQATLTSFFFDLWQQGAIGTSDPQQIPYAIAISNNQSQVTSGQMIASVQVTYLSVIDDFIVNVEGGQTVVQPSGNPQPLNVGA